VPVDARTSVVEQRAMVEKGWARMHAELVLRLLKLLASEGSSFLNSLHLLLGLCCWLNADQTPTMVQAVVVRWAGIYVSNGSMRQAC